MHVGSSSSKLPANQVTMPDRCVPENRPDATDTPKRLGEQYEAQQQIMCKVSVTGSKAYMYFGVPCNVDG